MEDFHVCCFDPLIQGFLNGFERLLKITFQFMANFILYSYLFEYSLSPFILDRIDWRHPTSM